VAAGCSPARAVVVEEALSSRWVAVSWDDAELPPSESPEPAPDAWCDGWRGLKRSHGSGGCT
jgi:hypothetical protein